MVAAQWFAAPAAWLQERAPVERDDVRSGFGPQRCPRRSLHHEGWSRNDGAGLFLKLLEFDMKTFFWAFSTVIMQLAETIYFLGVCSAASFFRGYRASGA